jgi:predicted thioesterase
VSSGARHRLSDTRPVPSVVGTQQTICYRVRRPDLARIIYLGMAPSQWKPFVLATARLVWLCELATMLPIPGVSLGTDVHVKHLAPAVRGALVTVTATCIAKSEKHWEWALEVRDDSGEGDTGELIASCSLRFAAGIDPQRYRRRLAPKLAGRSVGLLVWLGLLDLLKVLGVAAFPMQLAYLESKTSTLATQAILVVGWLITQTGFPTAVLDWCTVRRINATRKKSRGTTERSASPG